LTEISRSTAGSFRPKQRVHATGLGQAASMRHVALRDPAGDVALVANRDPGRAWTPSSDDTGPSTVASAPSRIPLASLDGDRTELGITARARGPIFRGK
jgi:hypothetical protein